ncbi:ABC-2 transporter permease [Irregularibacter muris]|uniref:ABC-2 transporter permease n=1 Tax=Irregularibacter muris TaxID=1796619 RepID=A0AAE3HFW1_9FIRM|nr:ABC-2 transporter permease [Irregularibacter muris]MCR1898363.1 ABC-2 transporter permease [Irregularibacter muris]
MFALIKKDLILSFGNKQTYFLLLFYPLLLLFITGMENPGIMIFACVSTFTFLLPLISFAYEELLDSNMLLGSLPIKRWEVVVNKYIFALIVFGLSIPYTYLYMSILNFLGFNILEFFHISLIKDVSFFSLFSLSIAIPLHYIFPSKIARLAHVFIYILLTNHFVLQGSTTLLKGIQSPLLGIGIFLLSLGISIALYQSKDVY